MRHWWKMWDALAHLRFGWRCLLKCGLFLVALFFVLNPHLRLFIRQLWNYAHVEALIQTDFAGMTQINQEIDTLVPNGATQEAEFNIIQNYVYRNIPYQYDWDNWGNVDFWPTAAEVWQRKREDCDGQAVLAVSILRARGFQDATLAGSFRHIWVNVGKIGLMSPDTEQNLRRENGKTIVTLPSLKLLLQNSAIFWGAFPVMRNLLLLFVLLGLAYHPCRRVTPFLGIAISGLIGYLLMKDWARIMQRADSLVINANLLLGAGFLAAAVLYPCFMDGRLLRRIRFFRVHLKKNDQFHYELHAPDASKSPGA